MLQLYIDLALSRLARHAIQPIQLYSYTAIHAIQHTAPYSLSGQFINGKGGNQRTCLLNNDGGPTRAPEAVDVRLG